MLYRIMLSWRMKIMYNKNDLDKQAECEGFALTKQGKHERPRRIMQEISEYNKEKFEKLFKK